MFVVAGMAQKWNVAVDKLHECNPFDEPEGFDDATYEIRVRLPCILNSFDFLSV